jgi:flagellin
MATLQKDLDRIEKSTSYKGVALLDETKKGTMSFQAGLGAPPIALSTGNLSLADVGKIDVRGGPAASRAAVETISDALDSVSSARAQFSQTLNRLTASTEVLSAARSNQTDERIKIRDLEMAEITAKISYAQVLAQSSTAILAQANSSSASTLALLR